MVLAALLAVVVIAHEELAGWALAGAVLAPIAGVALLAINPVLSLGVGVLTAVATAPAMAGAVPPWTVALGAAVAVLSALAGVRAARPVPALVTVGAGAALAAALTLVDEIWSAGLVLLAVTVLLPWLLGRTVYQQTTMASAATDQVHLRERARIAHDMHDTLGHELSLLALHAGALELAPDLDERHRQAIGRLRAGAAAATERLADIVAVLRDGEPVPPVVDDLHDLVDRAARAGMAVSLDWSGTLPPMVHRTAHRVVQEGLTNAMKHAPGSAVQVRVVDAAATTVVTVTNAVPAKQRRGAGGRTGLVALRERVRLAGGTFQAGRKAGIFEIVATLPHTGTL